MFLSVFVFPCQIIFEILLKFLKFENYLVLFGSYQNFVVNNTQDKLEVGAARSSVVFLNSTKAS